MQFLYNNRYTRLAPHEDHDLVDLPLLKLYICDEIQEVIIYDAHTSEFIHLTEAEFKALKRILKSQCIKPTLVHSSASSRSDLLNNTLKGFLQEGFLIEGPLLQRVSTSQQDIKRLLQESFYAQPIDNLCLEATTNCNLRCSYCPFTIELLAQEQNWSRARKHGNKNMPFDIAMQALDFYFDEVKKRSSLLTSSKKHMPTLSFYGGEPLINIDLIIRCSEIFGSKFRNYIDSKNGAPLISLTTNLTTRNKDTIKELIKYDIDILVSLDGPKDENDRNRVFANGSGSVFETTLENLEHLFSLSPAYFQKRVHFSAVFAPGHSLSEITKFFSLKCPVSFSHLMTGDRVHYTTARYCGRPNSISFGRDDTKSWDIAQEEAIAELLDVSDREELVNWRSKNIIHNSIYNAFFSFEFRPRFRNQQKSINTAPTCIPGIRKMFVSVDGKIHICERTDHSMPLGNITDGYDIGLIEDLLLSYFDIMNSSRCRNCWGFRFCEFCPAPLISDGKIKYPSQNECSGFLRNLDSLLCKYLSVKLSKPSLFHLWEYDS